MLAIRNVQMLPDGRSLVETWGTWRFRVMERGTLDGYMVARIERIEDYEEELDDTAIAPEDPSEDDERQDPAEVGPDDVGAMQTPLGGRAVGGTTATAQVEEQHEAAVRAQLGDAATAAQTASILVSQSRPGAIHASSSTSLAESNSSSSHGHSPPTSQDEPVASKAKNPAASGAGAMPTSPQSPRPPTNAELMAKCHAFIDQMREGTPWVVQHLNNNYVPMPSDAASFSFWMALVVLWRVRRLLARGLPPRALGGWMWLVAYAIMLAAVYSAQADWRRSNAPAITSQGVVVYA
ncbi:LON peptidase N-terminal domain and RING finger protein 1 [Trametes pubescens]|uniref:LON peptidase N-terminal domain and RING finger protein 1 n=1 Tax=Trametes pubescens TaxID=154538 RepID=A0A1M2V829_TRAPU|nr:LON peptidase N-terminal domain and RING finger protein 1 [Trametes pubescens]